MGAPKGNQFWRARSTHGRKPIFETPEILEKACEEFFDWCEANPLQEEKVFAYQGDVIHTNVSKMRAMTITGLCLFLDISDDSWANYRKSKDFIGVVSNAEKTIYNQKFVGASADLLNANIIARDLGLKDKQELTGENGADLSIKVEFIAPKPVDPLVIDNKTPIKSNAE